MANTGQAAAAAAEAKRLKAAGRTDAALAHNLRAVEFAPDSAIAEHNLAATLGDLSRFEESAAAARRAITKGAIAPETRLVLARALQGLRRLDEAERAFQAAIAARGDYVDAHRDLAQLRWMRSADPAYAVAILDRSIAQAPRPGDLVGVKARLLLAAGEVQPAVALLDAAILHDPAALALRVTAAQACAQAGDAEAQLGHATAALRIAPASAEAAKAAVEALLHLARAGEAAALAERILRAVPHDLGVMALLAMAWRLLGDPRFEALYGDERLVRAMPIATPPGWPDLDSYLVDLVVALERRHGWRTHPVGQSLRHGSQTQENLIQSDDPVIRALFKAVEAPIRTYIDGLGPGDDPTRARATGRFRILGAWSVLLRPGGYHVDHVHPQGWLSSAIHVALPNAVEEGHAGWLAFGRPGIPTRPRLDPVRHIRPRPGHLVLFPSYFWHGTEPFGGDAPRLTVAFDILPD